MPIYYYTYLFLPPVLHMHTYPDTIHTLNPHTHTHIHTRVYREEATDIIKASTKKVGSGALAAWEEEQNDVISLSTILYP